MSAPESRIYHDVLMLDSAFPLSVYEHEVGVQPDLSKVRLHFHECLEINLVLAGEGTNLIEETALDMRVGDVFAINNLERHMAVTDRYMKEMVIVFHPSALGLTDDAETAYLAPFFSRTDVFSHRVPAQEAHQMRRTVLRIQEEMQAPAGLRALLVRPLMLELLSLLYRFCMENGMIAHGQQCAGAAYRRMKPLLDEIHARYSQPLSLTVLAQAAGMNKNYFSEYFRAVFGMGAMEYVQRLRVNRAAELLAGSALSVTEICYAAGFQSLAHFSRVFRRYKNVAPTVYRREHRSEE